MLMVDLDELATNFIPMGSEDIEDLKEVCLLIMKNLAQFTVPVDKAGIQGYDVGA